MIPVANRRFTIFVEYYAFPASSFHFSLLYLFHHCFITYFIRVSQSVQLLRNGKDDRDSIPSGDTDFYFSTVS